MKKLTLILLVLAISTTFCGKKGFEIGRTNPQFEIQKCMKLSDSKDFAEAIECLEVFRSRFPQTSYSTQAELAIADNYFKNKDYLMAADAYLSFGRMHPLNSKVAYAYYRLGLSYLKESPKSIDRDQQYLDEAVHYLRVAVMGYPNSEYNEAAKESLKDARTRMAAREYYVGRFYYRTGEYMAAIPRFLTVVNKYKDTDLVPESLYKLVVSATRLDLKEDAKLYFSKLSIEFPTTKWTEKAEKKLQRFLKKKGD